MTRILRRLSEHGRKTGAKRTDYGQVMADRLLANARMRDAVHSDSIANRATIATRSTGKE